MVVNEKFLQSSTNKKSNNILAKKNNFLSRVAKKFGLRFAYNYLMIGLRRIKIDYQHAKIRTGRRKEKVLPKFNIKNKILDFLNFKYLIHTYYKKTYHNLNF